MESPKKKTTAALLAGLTAGGAAGAMLLAPGVSLAQEAGDTTTDTTAASPADATADATARHRHPGQRGERFANLAEIIGIDEDALKTALKDGQTIAEVAEANGVDPDALVDQLVSDATARIEERLAELPTRIEEMVNREFDGRGPGLDGPPDDAPVEDAGN